MCLSVCVRACMYIASPFYECCFDYITRMYYCNTLPVAVTCGAPGVPEHATTKGDTFMYEDRVIFECAPGYEIIAGDSEMICSATTEWNGTLPTCSSRSIYIGGQANDV